MHEERLRKIRLDSDDLKQLHQHTTEAEYGEDGNIPGDGYRGSPHYSLSSAGTGHTGSYIRNGRLRS